MAKKILTTPIQKSDLEDFLLRNEIPAIYKENTIENHWKK